MKWSNFCTEEADFYTEGCEGSPKKRFSFFLNRGSFIIKSSCPRKITVKISAYMFPEPFLV